MIIYGPYTRKDKRKHIIIIHANGERQTKSWPKYLLEQKIGRELEGDETCDHIDEDFTNDHPDNLQVLSRSKNAEKSGALRETEYYYFVCPQCGTDAKKEMRNVRGNWKKGRPGPYCSRSCAGLTNHKKRRTAFVID